MSSKGEGTKCGRNDCQFSRKNKKREEKSPLKCIKNCETDMIPIYEYLSSFLILMVIKVNKIRFNIFTFGFNRYYWSRNN